MIKLIPSLAVVLLVATSANSSSWRGIIPLHSTRADVERLLGKPNGKYGRYDLENEEVEIRYSKGPCANGWNVSAGTVIDIAAYPKRSVRFSDLKIDLSKFQRVRDPEVTSHVYYVSRSEGIRYTVYEDERETNGRVLTTYYESTIEDERLLYCRKSASSNRGDSSEQSVRTVSFCDLVTHPTLYDLKIIRTRAIMVAGYEQSFLYSPHCNSRARFVWAARDTSFNPNPTAEKALDSIVDPKATEGTGRAEVVVLGRFQGPTGKRYGHLDQFRMQLLIKEFQMARAVSSKMPWSSTREAKGGTSQTEQIIRQINKEFVLCLAKGSCSGIPSELLADSFSFTDVDGIVINKTQLLGRRMPNFAGKIYDMDIEVYVHGDAAAASGLLVKSAENSAEERYRYTNRYLRHGGAWQIVSSQLRRA